MPRLDRWPNQNDPHAPKSSNTYTVHSLSPGCFEKWWEDREQRPAHDMLSGFESRLPSILGRIFEQTCFPDFPFSHMQNKSDIDDILGLLLAFIQSLDCGPYKCWKLDKSDHTLLLKAVNLIIKSSGSGEIIWKPDYGGALMFSSLLSDQLGIRAKPADEKTIHLIGLDGFEFHGHRWEAQYRLKPIAFVSSISYFASTHLQHGARDHGASGSEPWKQNPVLQPHGQTWHP